MNEGDDLIKFGHRTLAFLGRYDRVRAAPHAAIALALLAAVDAAEFRSDRRPANGNIVQDGEPGHLLRADGPYRTLAIREGKHLSKRRV
jgi:hypothetical protein